MTDTFHPGDRVEVIRLIGGLYTAESLKLVGQRGRIDSELYWFDRALRHTVTLEDGHVFEMQPTTLKKLSPPPRQDWNKLCELNRIVEYFDRVKVARG